MGFLSQIFSRGPVSEVRGYASVDDDYHGKPYLAVHVSRNEKNYLVIARNQSICQMKGSETVTRKVTNLQILRIGKSQRLSLVPLKLKSKSKRDFDLEDKMFLTVEKVLEISTKWVENPQERCFFWDNSKIKKTEKKWRRQAKKQWLENLKKQWLENLKEKFQEKEKIEAMEKLGFFMRNTAESDNKWDKEKEKLEKEVEWVEESNWFKKEVKQWVKEAEDIWVDGVVMEKSEKEEKQYIDEIIKEKIKEAKNKGWNGFEIEVAKVKWIEEAKNAWIGKLEMELSREEEGLEEAKDEYIEGIINGKREKAKVGWIKEAENEWIKEANNKWSEEIKKKWREKIKKEWLEETKIEGLEEAKEKWIKGIEEELNREVEKEWNEAEKRLFIKERIEIFQAGFNTYTYIPGVTALAKGLVKTSKKKQEILDNICKVFSH